MTIPPPASGAAYPNTTTSEIQENYLSGSVAASGGYVSNVLPSQTATPVNDYTYAVFPTIAISRTAPRQQVTLSYTPSFIFYQPTNVLDTVDQGAALTFQDRLSRSVTFSLQDSFYRSSNVFDQSLLFSAGAITGSTQTPVLTVIFPFTQQLSNMANAVIGYQFGRNSMVGGGASYSFIDFSDPAVTSGISDSNLSGGSAFYNLRLSRGRYTGVTYQYSRGISELVNQQSETQSHSVLPYYTIYFARAFSFSISAGVQYVEASLPKSLTSNSWSPAGVASVGWQNNRSNLAASFSRTTSSEQGLIGAYNTYAASLAGNWRVARSWTLGLSAYYTTTANATPELISTYAGGTMIAGQASVTHSLGEHFTATLGYERLHQQYSSIPIISENPDSDQGYGRIAYQFRAPLRK
jgi:hypothetical protein